MKQSVSPAAMAAIIVVVVGLVGFFGYRMFFSGPGTGGPKPAGVSDGRKFQDQYQNYGQARARATGNPAAGGFQSPTGAPSGGANASPTGAPAGSPNGQ